jgi:hypothetical protein
MAQYENIKLYENRETALSKGTVKKTVTRGMKAR